MHKSTNRNLDKMRCQVYVPDEGLRYTPKQLNEVKIGDSRINEAEERISGDRLVAIRAMEKNTKKKKKNKKEKLTDCLRDF